MTHIPNLKKSRHGIYYWRQKCCGKETAISLQTKDFKQARILALKIHLAKAELMPYKKFDIELPNGVKVSGINTDEDVARLEQLSKSEFFDKLIQRTEVLKQAAHQLVTPKPIIKSKKFSDVVKLYIEERKISNSPKTISEKESKYLEFQTLFTDPDFNSISSETAISFKQKMISDGLSISRINKTISFFADLFNYGILNKYYYSSNPFENLAISTKGKTRRVKSYLQFTEDELKLIFDSQDNYIWMITTQGTVKQEYYWLPLIALFSGSRLGEIAGLSVSQIKQYKDIWYFDVVEEDDEGVKNDNSIRSIPIHKTLFEIGFIDYIKNLKDKKGRIFPSAKKTINGYGKNMSRRFNEEYLTKKLKITHQQKKFHSLRSTFINRMTYLNIHPAILQGIVGHYKQDKVDFSSAHFSVYQQKKPIEIMKEYIDKLEYTEIDFTKFKKTV